VGVARETVSRLMGRRAVPRSGRLMHGDGGGRPGHNKLSEAQQRRIALLSVGENPDQLRLPRFLWTRTLVRELIVQRPAAMDFIKLAWGAAQP
jgi:hypothetical protein